MLSAANIIITYFKESYKSMNKSIQSQNKEYNNKSTTSITNIQIDVLIRMGSNSIHNNHNNLQHNKQEILNNVTYPITKPVSLGTFTYYVLFVSSVV